jgi:hypothetical protein
MTALDRIIIPILAILDTLMDALTLGTWSATRGNKTIPYKATKTE